MSYNKMFAGVLIAIAGAILGGCGINSQGFQLAIEDMMRRQFYECLFGDVPVGSAAVVVEHEPDAAVEGGVLCYRLAVLSEESDRREYICSLSDTWERRSGQVVFALYQGEESLIAAIRDVAADVRFDPPLVVIWGVADERARQVLTQGLAGDPFALRDFPSFEEVLATSPGAKTQTNGTGGCDDS